MVRIYMLFKYFSPLIPLFQRESELDLLNEPMDVNVGSSSKVPGIRTDISNHLITETHFWDFIKSFFLTFFIDNIQILFCKNCRWFHAVNLAAALTLIKYVS